MTEFITFSDKKPCFNENWSGIQLISLNYDSYVIPFKEVMTGISEFFLVDCFGNETNISKSCKIVGKTIEISKLTYDTDRRVYLKIKGNKDVYSNILKVSSENKEYTTRIDYRCKSDNILYSIQLQIFEMYSKRVAELSSYYQISTHKQVSFLPSNAKYFVFKSRMMYIETLNKIIDIFNNREVYFDYEQVNLFNAPDIDDPEPYTYVVESNFEITKLGNRIDPKVYLISENNVTKSGCVSICQKDFSGIINSTNYVLKKGVTYVHREDGDTYFIFDENATRMYETEIISLPDEILKEQCTLIEGYERIITDNYEQILIKE